MAALALLLCCTMRLEVGPLPRKLRGASDSPSPDLPAGGMGFETEAPHPIALLSVLFEGEARGFHPTAKQDDFDRRSLPTPAPATARHRARRSNYRLAPDPRLLRNAPHFQTAPLRFHAGSCLNPLSPRAACPEAVPRPALPCEIPAWEAFGTRPFCRRLFQRMDESLHNAKLCASIFLAICKD